MSRFIFGENFESSFFLFFLQQNFKIEKRIRLATFANKKSLLVRGSYKIKIIACMIIIV